MATDADEAGTSLLSKHNLTQQDITSAINLLAAITEDQELKDHACMREVRKKVFGLANANLPDKKKIDAERKKKEEKNRKNDKKRKMQELDQKRTEAVGLRVGRMAALEALCEANEQDEEFLSVVPDGGVFTVPTIKDKTHGVLSLENNNTSSPTLDSSPNSSPKILNNNSQHKNVDGKDCLEQPKSCYVCKVKFWKLHHFYETMCPTCAALNWEKRHQFAKLDKNVICLVTGGRVKIGFQTALKLLNCGATVIVTTRFRNDCLERFMGLPNFEAFKDRLIVLGVDLRFLQKVEQLCAYIDANFSHLDVIIHNACQTIRRPQAYYEPLRDKEGSYFSGKLYLENEVKLEEINKKENSNSPKSANPQSNTISVISQNGATAHIPEITSNVQTDLKVDERKKMLPKSGVFYDYTSSMSYSNVDDGRNITPESKKRRISGKDEDNDVNMEANLETGNNSRVRSASPQKRNSAHRALVPQNETQVAVLAEDRDIKVGSKELPGYTDVNGQLIDFRQKHSWVYKLEEVETGELCETFLINAMSPFIMNGKLKHVLERSPRKRKFIVNVSAMEGKFYRYKTPNHPHTNMAKAALNMMTKTSAQEFAKKSNIYMTSIDTGWINDEKPIHMAYAHTTTNKSWQTPIDEIDAAARVLDPVICFIEQEAGDVESSINFAYRQKAKAEEKSNKPKNNDPSKPQVFEGSRGVCEEKDDPPFGVFLKDFRITEW